MKKIFLPLTIVVLLAVLIGLVFFLIRVFRPKVAGLYVESTPTARVLINGQEVGSTPFRSKTLKPGGIAVRLIPQDTSATSVPYDTKINLAANIETVLRREFGATEEVSSTELISFEKTPEDEASVAIVTIPSDAQVIIDNDIKVFSPYKTSSLTSGEHSAKIFKEGFAEEEIRFKTHSGYRLIVYLVMKKDNKAILTPIPTPPLEILVEILTTPTGFLRVRKEPSTVAIEVAQVEQGKTYRFVEEDVQTGWYKIEYEQGLFGWISNQFARKTDGTEAESENQIITTLSPTLTSTPTID